jgi:hypothetical protein
MNTIGAKEAESQTVSKEEVNAMRERLGKLSFPRAFSVAHRRAK